MTRGPGGPVLQNVSVVAHQVSDPVADCLRATCAVGAICGPSRAGVNSPLRPVPVGEDTFRSCDSLGGEAARVIHNDLESNGKLGQARAALLRGISRHRHGLLAHPLNGGQGFDALRRDRRRRPGQGGWEGSAHPASKRAAPIAHPIVVRNRMRAWCQFAAAAAAV